MKLGVCVTECVVQEQAGTHCDTHMHCNTLILTGFIMSCCLGEGKLHFSVQMRIFYWVEELKSHVLTSFMICLDLEVDARDVTSLWAGKLLEFIESWLILQTLYIHGLSILLYCVSNTNMAFSSFALFFFVQNTPEILTWFIACVIAEMTQESKYAFIYAHAN